MRGRSVEPRERGRLHANGHTVDSAEPQKSISVPKSPRRKHVKASTAESTGFGRTISKKSLDMAIGHMDIRTGPGSTRPLPATILYPQSIRSSASKAQPAHASSTQTSVDCDGSLSISCHNGYISESGKCANGSLDNRNKGDRTRLFGRVSKVDIFESFQYDAILLKEDLMSTSWLHTMDDKSDQGPIFDNGFEPLQEPFSLS
ncbi:hypothetical protein Ancab_031362 [Ancistrocladus abbreviatus]